jgi:Tfp pilus assembly protein FimT
MKALTNALRPRPEEQPAPARKAARRGPLESLGMRPRRRAAHTLVEMLIVLVVLAVTATLAMPRLNYVALRLDGNSRIVRNTLQQAWRASVQKQHDILVSFDTAGRSIRTIEDTNGDNQVTAGERVLVRPLEEGVRFDTPSASIGGYTLNPVTGPGVRSINALPTVIFRRNGSTSGDAEIYVSARNKSVKEWRAVTLAQSTGRTEWFRLVSGAWRSGGN